MLWVLHVLVMKTHDETLSDLGQETLRWISSFPWSRRNHDARASVVLLATALRQFRYVQPRLIATMESEDFLVTIHHKGESWLVKVFDTHTKREMGLYTFKDEAAALKFAGEVI